MSGSSGRRFDEQDVELARRCATAIDNARLYTERSYIARTLQESLLPIELPDIPGVEAAVLSQGGRPRDDIAVLVLRVAA